MEDYHYLSDETDIEAEFIKDEEKKTLHNAIRKLKTEYAQVLYLTYFEGLTNGEAGKVMGKSPRQISDLLYRAKESLRAQIERRENNG